MKTHHMWAVFDQHGGIYEVVGTRKLAVERAKARFGWDTKFREIHSRLGVYVSPVDVTEVRR